QTRDCIDTVLPATFCDRLTYSNTRLPSRTVITARQPERDLFPGALDANVDILAVWYPRPYLIIGIQCAREGNPTVGHRTVTAAQTGGGRPWCHIDDVTVVN